MCDGPITVRTVLSAHELPSPCHPSNFNTNYPIPHPHLFGYSIPPIPNLQSYTTTTQVFSPQPINKYQHLSTLLSIPQCQSKGGTTTRSFTVSTRPNHPPHHAKPPIFHSPLNLSIQYPSIHPRNYLENQSTSLSLQPQTFANKRKHLLCRMSVREGD